MIEHGADLTKRNDAEMNCFDEVIKEDNLDLLECIWPYTRYLKRNKQEVTLSFFPLINWSRLHILICYISLQEVKEASASTFYWIKGRM